VLITLKIKIMRIEDAFGENLSSFDEIDVRGTKYLKSFKGAAKAKRQALKDMRDGGFIKKESQNTDDYINEKALDVVLDDVLLVENTGKFISVFHEAMQKGLDDVVFNVIDNYGSSKTVAKQIIKSNNYKYIRRLVIKHYLSDDMFDMIDKNIKHKIIGSRKKKRRF